VEAVPLAARRGRAGLVSDVARPSKSRTAGKDNDPVVLRLKALSEEAAYIASALASRPPDGDGDDDAPIQGHSKSPEEVLKILIETRRIRFRHFAASSFTDPGWDILLDLMSARFAKRPVQVSNACVAAGVPATTALRWVDQLAKTGLVRRLPDPADRRRVLLELTDEGCRRIETYLRAVGRLLG
jgi:DNA-binding MarR family transcriptional regulator